MYRSSRAFTSATFEQATTCGEIRPGNPSNRDRQAPIRDSQTLVTSPTGTNSPRFTALSREYLSACSLASLARSISREPTSPLSCNFFHL